MANWYILTVVGKDQPGIVAQVSEALFTAGCDLGEASMMRLGESFTIMLMVSYQGSADSLRALLAMVAETLQLKIEIDSSPGGLHQHIVPDVQISVYGADRPGIVAQVTTALAAAGLNIVNLDSDVAGDEEQPIYIMHIDGVAGAGIAALESALRVVTESGVEVKLSPIETMIG